MHHIVPENISVLCEHRLEVDFVCVDVNCIPLIWFNRYKSFISEYGASNIITFDGMQELDSVQAEIFIHSECQSDSAAEEISTIEEKFLYDTPEMQEFERKIKIACNTDTTVLLVGESGSGKDFAARYIHEHSLRKKCEFYNQNVAEINNELFESSLFGTTKGAFTDAQEKKGVLEETKGGTVFFDEIAELSIENQGKLLGLLDNLVYRKVGSVKEQPVDVRFIFATDADLEKIVKQHLFRIQLYYRISVFVIEVPPLRKHMQDVAPLAVKFAEEYGKRLTENAINKLIQYDWPGNIRQLKNCMWRGSILSRSDIIDAEHIEFY
ncbi:MAG: sigma 54-interacting transcriptional regulator [Treponema sp.]|nr:sigma 54-interacting transcriptional regulator [Treponema sp.]